MVENHDWAKVVSEPTSETIDRLLPQELVQSLDPVKTVELHKAIRAIVAAEMFKLEHGYSSRADLIAANNVAYALAERGATINGWEPRWSVVTTYADGSEDEQPFDSYDDAYYDADVTMTMSERMGNRMTSKLRMR